MRRVSFVLWAALSIAIILTFPVALSATIAEGEFKALHDSLNPSLIFLITQCIPLLSGFLFGQARIGSVNKKPNGALDVEGLKSGMLLFAIQIPFAFWVFADMWGLHSVIGVMAIIPLVSWGDNYRRYLANKR